MQTKSRGLVVAAMSGGVDSAVAAAMLVREGYDVVGVTMRLYNARGTVSAAGGRCCGPKDIEDARRVCDAIGIPFYVVDFEEEFNQRVVEDFISGYAQGQTPNPCVKCNQYIKFTPLLQHARGLGASAVVTGHYAKIETHDGHLRLLRGKDPVKDQSYFLFSMPIADLAEVQFPLGGFTKEQVRKMAEEWGLPNASKAESQEICFVPDGDYAGFVARANLKRGKQLPPGRVLDDKGEQVGTHEGIHQFTVGQRRGLGNARSAPLPMYVSHIDPEQNTVYIGPKEVAHRKQAKIGNVRWFGAAPTAGQSFAAKVQVRHRGQPTEAIVTPLEGGRAAVEFSEPNVAAPGQAAVFYHDDMVLGGGWILPSPLPEPASLSAN